MIARILRALRYSAAGVVLAVLLAACGTAGSASSGVQPAAVQFTAPPQGMTVYAELLYAAGTSDRPNTRFTLLLLLPDDTVLMQASVLTDADGAWSLELVHGYSGEPAELTLVARPQQDPLSATPPAPYASTTVLIADSRYRPAGTFAGLTFPAPGAEVGGETIPVSGAASGLPNNSLTIALIGADGSEITRQTVIVETRYPLDVVPFTADLPLAGYAGAATVRLLLVDPQTAAETILAAAAVTIGGSAG